MTLNTTIVPLSMLPACCAGQPDYRESQSVPETVSEVDVDGHKGRWHEIARYPNSFEKGCLDTKAEYALKPDGSISVLNSCALASSKTTQAEGRAGIVEGSNGARLKVRFAPDLVPFAEDDYWIFYLESDCSAVLVGELGDPALEIPTKNLQTFSNGISK